jgi:hypothetical protein
MAILATILGIAITNHLYPYLILIYQSTNRSTKVIGI